MVSNWEEKPIGEIADVIGGSTPKTSNPEFWGGSIPWITPKDLSIHQERYISQGERNIAEVGLQSSSARLLPKNTVLLSSRAPIGYVAIAKNPVTTNQGFKSLVLREGYVPEFYYYFLKANVDLLESHANGSTFKEISGSIVKNIKVPVPPPGVQKEIAHILGTLDDKIELNQQMNRKLEAIARAIFKSWFVDFDPVHAKMEGRQPVGMDAATAALFPDSFEDSHLGEIPKGWSLAHLNKIANFTKGVSYKSQELQESNVALVTLKSIAPGGGYQEKGLKPYIGKFKPQQQLQPGDLVVAHTDLTQAAEVLGRVARVRSHPNFSALVASLDLVIVRSAKQSVSNEFLHGLLSQNGFQEHAYRYSNGTTVLHLGAKALPEYLFVLPASEIVETFTKLVQPIHQQTEHNQEQSRILAAVRDALLPKLMSGEFRVKDAEKLVEAAA